MIQPRLTIVPCDVTRANRYVQSLHRHHKPVTQSRFSLAVADEEGVVRGVAIVGRPVARLLDDGWTLEVNRVATDGCPNACSALYGAVGRIARQMGYRRVYTYTRVDEPGASLRGAGWTLDDPAIRARSWNMPNRQRTDNTEVVQRQRWMIDTDAQPMDLTWPHAPDESSDQMELVA